MDTAKTVNAVKSRYKSKTYRLGLVVIVLAYTQDNFGLVSQYLGEYSNLVNYVIGGSILILREMTKEPLSSKVKDKNAL